LDESGDDEGIIVEEESKVEHTMTAAAETQIAIYN
jgi:hypothetical protein